MGDLAGSALREQDSPAAFTGRGSIRQACAAFGIHKIHTEHCSKELEKRSRLCIIFSVTCYRNGAQGGRVENWVICRGAAPSSPSIRQGALLALS